MKNIQKLTAICLITAALLLTVSCTAEQVGSPSDTTAAQTEAETTASKETTDGLSQDTTAENTSSADTTDADTAGSQTTEQKPPVSEDTYGYYTQLQTPPSDSDHFAPDAKLNHRSTTVYANAFKGEFDSVVYENGGMRIADGKTSGTFTSEDIDLGGSFDKLICSWNAITNDGTVEIQVQTKKSNGTYSSPFSWGVWSSKSGVSGSASTSNSDGKVSIDELKLNSKCSGTVRFTVKLKKTAERSPVLYNVSFAVNKADGKLNAPDSCEVKLKVPKRIQGIVPEIGGRICSPTSLSMVLEYLGQKDFETADTAWAVYDNKKDIFGNWSFNVAHAGELGYNAMVEYYDIDALKYSLSKGTPVICSIKIKAGQLTESGYPNRSTNGHLIAVIGHTNIDGKDWVIINDPAVSSCEIKLLVSEFKTIWSGTCYILQQKPTK